MKAKQRTPLVKAYIYHKGFYTKESFVTKIFLLVNLFTPSFTFGLHTNPFMHYSENLLFITSLE